MIALLLACSWKPSPGPVPAELVEGPVRLVGQSVTGPLAWIDLTVRAGSAHDPIGAEGLAWLTARLLREGGAGDRSPEAVEQLLYGLGTDITVFVDQEQVSFRAKCLVEDLDAVADLMGDMLVEPALEASTLSRLREEATEWLTRGIFDSDEGLGMAVLDAWLFTGHPYGHPTRGRAGVVPLLDEQDVRDFLAARYTRSAMVLGIAGPMVAEDAILPHAPGAAAAALLQARLTEGSAPVRYVDVTPRAVEQPSGRELLVVEKSTEATGIHLGHPTTISRAHPDWPALVVAMTAFGEHRQSHGRLYQALRGERGLNYGDYAYVGIYRQAGGARQQQTSSGREQDPFYIWLRPTDTASGPFALKAAVKMTEELVASGLTEAEFERMRSYLSGSVALWAADPGRRLGWAVEAALMDWPDPITALPAALQDLTLSEVNAAIARHIDPDNLRIVVVTGDGEAFVEAVAPAAGEGNSIEGSATPIVYSTDAPEPGSPQALRDQDFAEYNLKLSGAQVLTTEELFR